MTTEMSKINVIIMGAAGRDFHNFNCCYRNDPRFRVVAFTATQIPNIEGRTYPAELAGKLYPEGIPIHSEDELEALIGKHKAELVVFGYSDVPYEYVMHQGARVNAAGANFQMIGAAQTMLPSRKPIVAVCAVRTGCGKSQTTRKAAAVLKSMGKRVAVVRHPMPYGDLRRQACQRFAELADMDRHECTIEEREEYELHIANGNLLFAGVDYHQILAAAEKEADVILWDGGNNDLPFFKPDLLITVADPHRPGHELSYYPGETNFRLADLILINKVNTAKPVDIETVEANARRINPRAKVVRADSTIGCDNPGQIKGKKVLVVEDGPTLTHGEMTYGAGTVLARSHGAAEIVDPRPWATGRIRDTFARYPGIGALLPAVGYGDAQVRDLEETIRRVPCDLVIVATPVDLTRIVRIDTPMLRARYALAETTHPDLGELLAERMKRWPST